MAGRDVQYFLSHPIHQAGREGKATGRQAAPVLLPPLPPHDAIKAGQQGLKLTSYNAGTLQDYARAAVLADRARDVPVVTSTGWEKWLQADHIRLHAGEMTTQELRTVQAVVRAMLTEATRGEAQTDGEQRNG